MTLLDVYQQIVALGRIHFSVFNKHVTDQDTIRYIKEKKFSDKEAGVTMTQLIWFLQDEMKGLPVTERTIKYQQLLENYYRIVK